VAVLAHQEAGARHDIGVAGLTTAAHRRAGGIVIEGRKELVAHAPSADALIVSARLAGDGELALIRVPAGTRGLKILGYRALDGAPAADIELNGVELPAQAMIASGEGAHAAIETGQDAGIAAVCAEAVGAMHALIGTTSEYLRTRHQFGRPIGRFQALQHRAADMLIHFEQAKSMSYLATLHVRSADSREKRRALSAAKVLVGRACRFVGQQAVQLHGGMGVTDELNVSHYFKRLTAIELSFGDAESHLDRFIANG
jgi:alkylation response protein AidB-like acyl-CoA dehydrogenase